MNVKNLAIAVALLAVIAGIVAWLDRPTPAPSSDPLIGQPLLAASLAGSAESLTITQNSNAVTVARNPNGDWIVPSYHDLPADFDKLRRFIGDLTAAKIDRMVTRLPERISRLDFGSASITVKPTEGEAWTVQLGKTADRGGRYLRFDSTGDSPAYLSQFSASLDTTAKNWAASKLLSLQASDIAAVSLSFPGAETVSARRESADQNWANSNAPDTRAINATRLGSLLTSLSNLRFTDVSTPDDPDAVDAAANARTIILETFDGQSLTITMGRRPEVVPESPPAAPTETPDAATPAADPTPETIPAGPVFVKIEGPTSAAPLADRTQLAFKVSDYTFTGLPANPTDLLVAPPSPVPSTPAVAAP